MLQNLIYNNTVNTEIAPSTYTYSWFNKKKLGFSENVSKACIKLLYFLVQQPSSETSEVFIPIFKPQTILILQKMLI